MDTKGLLIIGAAIAGLYLLSRSGVLSQAVPQGPTDTTIRPSDNPGICTRYWNENGWGYAEDFPCGS